MYGEENVSELEEMRFDRWATNPQYYGTSATSPIGINVPEDSNRRMGERFGRVFFADMTGSAKNIGRVIGGEEEAERVVKEIIQCKETECPPEYEPTPYYSNGKCEDDQLYTCVGMRVPKGEGKTRKVTHE